MSTRISRAVREEVLRCHEDPSRMSVGPLAHAYVTLLSDVHREVVLHREICGPDEYPTASRYIVRSTDLIIAIESLVEDDELELIGNGVSHVSLRFGFNKILPMAVPLITLPFVQWEVRCTNKPIIGPIVVTGCLLRDDLRRGLGFQRGVGCEIPTTEMSYCIFRWFSDARSDISRSSEIEDCRHVIISPEKIIAKKSRVDWAAKEVLDTCYSPFLEELAKKYHTVIHHHVRKSSPRIKRVCAWLE